MPGEFVNQLHYGDNLVRLRGEGVDKAIPDEVADLIYLDPPFNSARNYNLLFKQHKGQDSPAQIMTFEDTWKWSPICSPFALKRLTDDHISRCMVMHGNALSLIKRPTNTLNRNVVIYNRR